MTNGDKIRSLNDNELADMINTLSPCACCAYRGQNCIENAYRCDEGMLKWLKQEATDD